MTGPGRIARALALVAAAAVISACGVGGIAAASGGGGGGGGGDAAKKQFPTAVVNPLRGRAPEPFIPIDYLLRDPFVRGGTEDRTEGGEDDPRVAVRPQFRLRTNGAPVGDWRDMTEAQFADTEGTRGLPLGVHRFLWNSLIDTGAFRGLVDVRVLAEYEPTAGIGRRFKSSEEFVEVDNRVASTVFGGDVRPGADLDTFPVDIRVDGNGFIVGALGGNIVERVDNLGQPSRLVGLGLPGKTGDGGGPGAARLGTLVALDVDPAGNIYTNHFDAVRVTNRTAANLDFGTVDVAPGTIDTGLPGLQFSRALRIHLPTGALLFFDVGNALKAFNPQDPADAGSQDITLAGTVIAPGATEVIVGRDSNTIGGTSPPRITDVLDGVGLAVGPDGEIYYAERSRHRVRVLNPRQTALTIGPHTVGPAEVVTVAGDGTPDFSGDGGDARLAQIDSPGGIDVNDDRVLFVADTLNSRIRAVNLGVAAATFAVTVVDPGDIDTVVGGGASAADGSPALDFQLTTANSVTWAPVENVVPAAPALLISDAENVVFVNGGTGGVTRYGRTVREGRAVRVYDASDRGGEPFLEPRAVTSQVVEGGIAVFVADRSIVRVMNFTDQPKVFGGSQADPGATSRLAGGSVPGFSGDGGPARSATFAAPAALAATGPVGLLVADTGNDRIRFINVDDPRAGSSQTVLGRTVAPGNVDTVIGGGSPPADVGDGLPPRQAVLSRPQGVAVTAEGGLVYVADTGNHRIRLVNPGPGSVTIAGVTVAAGTIGTVLGSGVPSFTADGPANQGTAFTLDTPTALAVDPQGLVYFADAGNARIRVLNTTAATVRLAQIDVPPGEVATLVGSGVRGNAFDGGFGPDVRIDTARGLFVQILADGSPVALYFADGPQHVVRMLNLIEGDVIVATDDPQNEPLRVPGGSVQSLGGGPNTPGFANSPDFAGDGGPARSMRFFEPWGITIVNVEGQPTHFLVADRGNSRLRRFLPPPLFVQ